MAALPICDELRRSVGKVDWEPQFILRCRREISEDVRLAREINALRMRLTAIVDEREAFAVKLDMLTGKYVPEDGLGSAVVATCEPSFFVACGSEGRRGIVEMIVSAMVSNTSGGGVSEVGEDLARVREYRGVVFGLNIGMRRREECIGEMEIPKVYTMDKRPLITELRYKADSFDWCDVLTYLCREAADEDRSIATKVNRLREEMLIICEKRRNIAYELRSVRGIVVVQKVAEFVAETVRKDNLQAAQLREVERQMESRALEKEMHVQKITRNIPY
ncbi:hypothetical protein Tco_0946084 [Tanacetum coccineum]